MTYCPHGTRSRDYLYEVEREYPPGTLNEKAVVLPLRTGRSTIASGTTFRTDEARGLFADCDIRKGTLFWDVPGEVNPMVNDPTVDMRPISEARTAAELRSALHDLVDAANRRVDPRINVVSAIDDEQIYDPYAPACYLALRDIRRGEEILRRYGPLVWAKTAIEWVTPANVAGYLAFAGDMSEMGGCCFGYLGIKRTCLLWMSCDVERWIAQEHPWLERIAGPLEMLDPALWDEAIAESDVDPKILYRMRWETVH